jgi:hypothetical protein
MWLGPGGRCLAASPASAGYASRGPSLRSPTTGQAALHCTTCAPARPSWPAAGSSTSGSGDMVPMDGLLGSTVDGQLVQHPMVPPTVSDWVADFGASNHSTSDAGNLTSVCPPHINDPSSIIVGNGSSLPVISIGDTAIPSSFYLNNVPVTPNIIKTLLSVRRFTTDNWCSVVFDPFVLFVKDLSTRNVITQCDSLGPLYTMCLPLCSTPLPSVAAPTALVASASTWHRHLGHPGIDTMSKLSNASSII